MEKSDLAFTAIWNKYRPAILRLMVGAESEPGRYKFSSHEFHEIQSRQKGSLAFTLSIHKSRAVNNIKASKLALALLSILRESETGRRLTETATYDLSLDKEFVLHVKRTAVEIEPVVAEAESHVIESI